jgi:hypothetical protein
MKRIKTGFLATVVLAAVASLFTVCKATGVGGDLFTTLFDHTIEVAYGEFRALQPAERKLLDLDPKKLTGPVPVGGGIALSDGNNILGVTIGKFDAEKYTLKVYDPGTPVAEAPQWPAALDITKEPRDSVYGLSEPPSALSVAASASGGGTLTYQWYKSAVLPGSTATPPDTGDTGEWTAITGATGASLGAGNIGTTAKGKTYYYVKVTNTLNGGTGTSNAAEIWVKTLSERVAAAAGTGSADSPAVITLYQSELLADGNGFAAGTADNIGADTHINIVSNDATQRVVQLDISGGAGYMFNIAGGGSLTLGGSVTLQGDPANTMSVVFVTGNGSTFEMGGSAKITGNQATNGGGVYVAAGGAFAMSGSAVISGNIASAASGTNSGGGVYVTGSGSTFTMSDSAAITGNAASATSGAKYGGGVYVASGNFTMSGSAEISGNQTASSASQYGGGVYALGGNLTIKGSALITGNTTKTGGGGVYASGGTFTMNGGTISHNSTTGATATGGGVYLAGGGSLAMSGGTVWGADGTDVPTSLDSGGKVPTGYANTATTNAALQGNVSFPGGNGYVGTSGPTGSSSATNNTLYVVN